MSVDYEAVCGFGCLIKPEHHNKLYSLVSHHEFAYEELDIYEVCEDFCQEYHINFGFIGNSYMCNALDLIIGSKIYTYNMKYNDSMKITIDTNDIETMKLGKLLGVEPQVYFGGYVY